MPEPIKPAPTTHTFLIFMMRPFNPCVVVRKMTRRWIGLPRRNRSRGSSFLRRRTAHSSCRSTRSTYSNWYYNSSWKESNHKGTTAQRNQERNNPRSNRSPGSSFLKRNRTTKAPRRQGTKKSSKSSPRRSQRTQRDGAGLFRALRVFRRLLGWKLSVSWIRIRMPWFFVTMD